MSFKLSIHTEKCKKTDTRQNTVFTSLDQSCLQSPAATSGALLAIHEVRVV